MSNESSETDLTALQMVTRALQAVTEWGGLPPGYEAPSGVDPQSMTVLAIAKIFAGEGVSEDELIAAIDVMSPFFTTVDAQWK